MERFYDGDQDQLFSEARVVNPFRKLNISNIIKVRYLNFYDHYFIDYIFSFRRDQ